MQGFAANETGVLSGVVGDIQIETGNLAPRQTTQVSTQVNLDARSPVLSRVGTTTTANGPVIGQPQSGIPAATASVLESAGAPLPFDYSIDEASAISAGNSITPFDFSINRPSSVQANSSVTGFDFSVNTPSSLSGSSAPINFNFFYSPVRNLGFKRFFRR